MDVSQCVPPAVGLMLSCRLELAEDVLHHHNLKTKHLQVYFDLPAAPLRNQVLDTMPIDLSWQAHAGDNALPLDLTRRPVPTCLAMPPSITFFFLPTYKFRTTIHASTSESGELWLQSLSPPWAARPLRVFFAGSFRGMRLKRR